jgi:hypothetical protein
MAKKGYPGLVLVPPSDRTILKRRLLRWALFIIALIWCASTLPLWPPASDDKANCLPIEGQDNSNSSAEKCGHPQLVTEPPPNQSEFSLTQVSQAEGLSESQNSPPSPAPDPDRHATQNDRDQGSKPKSSASVNQTPVSQAEGLGESPNLPLSPTPDPDRLVTQDDRGQGSKPKFSGPTNRFPDHNGAPAGNEKSASSLPTSKPTQHPDVDTRLAEQGDAFAQYRLGRFYAQRDGRQTPEAVSWYKKASPGLHRMAEAGNGQAMYVLGVMYAYGRGVTRDTERARRWLTQAIEQKITAAQPVLVSLERNRTSNASLQMSEQSRSTKREN